MHLPVFPVFIHITMSFIIKHSGYFWEPVLKWQCFRYAKDYRL